MSTFTRPEEHKLPTDVELAVGPSKLRNPEAAVLVVEGDLAQRLRTRKNKLHQNCGH